MGCQLGAQCVPKLASFSEARCTKSQVIQRVMELFGLPEGSILAPTMDPEWVQNRGGDYFRPTRSGRQLRNLKK